jgi:hypothetical protein
MPNEQWVCDVKIVLGELAFLRDKDSSNHG